MVFNFDGLSKLVLKMAKVRDENIYVSVTLILKMEKEIANQLLPKSSEPSETELELKNIDDINGVHKIYLSYYQNPFNSESTDAYIGNASDLVATYGENINPNDPTSSPKPTAEPTAPLQQHRLSMIMRLLMHISTKTESSVLISIILEKAQLQRLNCL